MQTLPITVTPEKNGYVAECRVFNVRVRIERPTRRAAYREACKAAELAVSVAVKLFEQRNAPTEEVQFTRVDREAALIAPLPAPRKDPAALWVESVAQAPRLQAVATPKGPPKPSKELGITVDHETQTIQLPGALFDQIMPTDKASPEFVKLPLGMADAASLGNQEWILGDLEIWFARARKMWAKR